MKTPFIIRDVKYTNEDGDSVYGDCVLLEDYRKLQGDPKQNPAAFPPSPDELNHFTERLKDLIEERGRVMVKMRDGRLIEVYWKEEDEEEQYFCNFDNRSSFVWNKDGTSITSRNFDLIEIYEP